MRQSRWCPIWVSSAGSRGSLRGALGGRAAVAPQFWLLVRLSLSILQDISNEELPTGRTYGSWKMSLENLMLDSSPFPPTGSEQSTQCWVPLWSACWHISRLVMDCLISTSLSLLYQALEACQYTVWEHQEHDIVIIRSPLQNYPGRLPERGHTMKNGKLH